MDFIPYQGSFTAAEDKQGKKRAYKKERMSSHIQLEASILILASCSISVK